MNDELSPEQVSRIQNGFRVPVDENMWFPDQPWVAYLWLYSVEPTDDELTAIREFIVRLVERRYRPDFRDEYLGDVTQPDSVWNQHLARDDAFAAIAFIKRGAGDWAYRRTNWDVGSLTGGAWPHPSIPVLTLDDLIAHIMSSKGSSR